MKMPNSHRSERALLRLLREEGFRPPSETVARSRQQLQRWYEGAAPSLHWSRLASPLGTIHLAAGESGLVAIRFTEATDEFLLALDPMARLVEGGPEIEPYRRQLQEYFHGERKRFTLPTNLSGLTSFQRSVLKAIDEIPAGEVRSYGEIARRIGKPRSARAVGQALANNPIPIVLPCHRVLASDGGLGGYAGGLARKRQLLRLEGAPLS